MRAHLIKTRPCTATTYPTLRSVNPRLGTAFNHLTATASPPHGQEDGWYENDYITRSLDGRRTLFISDKKNHQLVCKTTAAAAVWQNGVRSVSGLAAGMGVCVTGSTTEQETGCWHFRFSFHFHWHVHTITPLSVDGPYQHVSEMEYSLILSEHNRCRCN